ncbi:MAG: L-threonylcarbamoyladenylate synthase [Tepidiformaceae bacterium]
MLRTLNPSSESIRAAADALRQGGLVVVPTDTVYGITADVRRDDAVRKLYEAKGKGPEAPLQLLFSQDSKMLGRYALMDPAASKLTRALGPGAWTVICRAAPGWVSPALAGGTTVGIRVPDATVVHHLVGALGAPLVASSANRHGSPSPVTVEAAVSEVGECCELALDGGPTPEGLDSTVIDCASDSPQILREGAIDRHTVARILGLRDIPVVRSVRK